MCIRDRGYLEDIALISDIDSYNESADQVVLMTIHSAKGLEFPMVFVTGMEEGRPLFMRLPDSAFTFQNFARTQLYSAMATLKIGMDILIEKEHAEVDSLLGHGGFFKAKGVGQKLMAGALHTPVSVMETAGEGGPWGMALLASYLVNAEDGETLEDYLDKNIFAEAKSETAEPDETDMQGFDKFLERYKATLPVEKSAVETLK